MGSAQPQVLVNLYVHSVVVVFFSVISRGDRHSFLSSRPRESPRANVDLFAGAIGGTVGLLFFISLGLAISLFRKKRAARNRTPVPVRDDASLFTEGSDDSSHIGRPSSFVPRYFSDHVHQPPPCKRGGRGYGDGRNSGSSTDFAERPPLNAHKKTVINPPAAAYIPGRGAICSSV